MRKIITIEDDGTLSICGELYRAADYFSEHGLPVVTSDGDGIILMGKDRDGEFRFGLVEAVEDEGRNRRLYN